MHPTSISPSLYLRWLSVSILAGIAAAITLVLLVDPYGLYGLIDRPGFNHIKPRLSRYQEQIKILQAGTQRNTGIIAGNSRAEIGFNPKSPALSEQGASFYNLGIPGTAIDTSRRELEALYGAGKKYQTLVLGIEFIDAIDIQKPPTQGGTSSSALVDTPALTRRVAQHFWRVDALYSLTSVKDAMQTLLIQHDNEAESSTAEGFNPLNEYKKFVRNDGYSTIFRQRALDYAKAFVRKSKGTIGDSDFKNLASILDTAAVAGTDIKLIIYPYHAQIMALFDETGLTPYFKQWKQRVLVEADAARTRHPGARISIFDFSGFGDYACSRILAAADRTGVSQWYWEAGHFKKELGDLVLARAFSVPGLMTQSDALPETKDDFGFRLEQGNFDRNERRIARERIACAAAYPDLFDKARQLVNPTSRILPAPK